MAVETTDNPPVSGSGALDLLVEEVGGWPEVEVGAHDRGGGPVFRVGRRELGHLHAGAGAGAIADLPFPRRVRDELIADGRARPHHVLPDSGWVTVPIRTAADLRGAVEVFRIGYERATRKRERRGNPGPGMESPIEGLHASPPEQLPFAPSLTIRAFLLEREPGNVLIYSVTGLDPEAAPIPALGGISRHYLNHGHEAMFASESVSAPLFVHASDRDAVAKAYEVRGTFTRRHTLDDDLEVIPTPGHTPGATAYLWDSGRHRFLFTGDTIYLRDGEWVGGLLSSSDREAFVESLELLRELDFDVLVPWAATAGQPYHALTDAADARRRIDAILERVRRGEDG